MFDTIHHIAIIGSDYEKSKHFYVDLLGFEIIREYYRIAPPIVDALNVSEERDTIYKDIWDRYILPCVRLIEQNDYKACCALYEKLVRNLKDTILKEN